MESVRRLTNPAMLELLVAGNEYLKELGHKGYLMPIKGERPK